MVTIRLKGIAKARAKGRSTTTLGAAGRVFGRARLTRFSASYNEAVESRRAPDTNRFRSLVVLYKGSGDYKGLADSTRRNWSLWLDRIAEHFGDLRIAQFDRPEKIRPVIRRWRNQWADKPRTADYGMQVLSRVLSYAVDPLGKIAGNPCEGIRQLYSVDRSEIIWAEADIAHLKVTVPRRLGTPSIWPRTPAYALAICYVSPGLMLATRRSSWPRARAGSGAKSFSAVRRTAKRAREHPEAGHHDPDHSRGRPWTTNGFGTAFQRAKAHADMVDRNLHFHDLRGTAATRFYTCGLSERVVAEIMGWEEEHVSKIIWRYVGRNAATEAAIRRLNAPERERRLQNRQQNRHVD